jgi:hypothetical protein
VQRPPAPTARCHRDAGLCAEQRHRPPAPDAESRAFGTGAHLDAFAAAQRLTDVLLNLVFLALRAVSVL